VVHLNITVVGEWEFLDSQAELFRTLDDMDANDKDAPTLKVVPINKAAKPHYGADNAQ
jgi:hypothetical protein